MSLRLEAAVEGVVVAAPVALTARRAGRHKVRLPRVLLLAAVLLPKAVVADAATPDSAPPRSRRS
jgi:hypothetical protein